MRGMDWISRLFLGVLLAVMASGAAMAREIPVETCIAQISEGETAGGIAAQQDRFDCRAEQNLKGSGDFAVLLRFVPVQPALDDPLVLRTNSVWQDAEYIRFRYADGHEQSLDFTSRTASRYITMGAIMEFPVPRHGAPLSSILIETQGSANLRGVVLGTSIIPRTEANLTKLWLVALYTGFAGLALALIVYNFSLWAAMRHRFQLYYCSMIAALAAYTFTSSGSLMLFATWIDNNDRLRLNYILLAISGITALRFIRNFFGAEVCGPRLTIAIRWSGYAALASALAFAALAPWQAHLLDRLYFIGMTAMLIMVFPLLYNAWRVRNRYLGLFLLAWSAPIIISVMRAAHGFNLIPQMFLLDNGNLVALSIEALLSSLLITARLRELGEERDHALQGEQTALHLANTDSLTGLLNRRSFLDFAIGSRSRQRLMLIDIDHFKLVNDRIGHEAGDQVLVAVANAIEACRPPRSLAVRLGGEEFALLMPRSLAEQCLPENLLEAVRCQIMPQGVKVTVSIGFSDGQVASEKDWKRLYRLADAALYRAKADGRDRACKATDFSVAA